MLKISACRNSSATQIFAKTSRAANTIAAPFHLPLGLAAMPDCPECRKPMIQNGRAFQCEACRQIVLYFLVSGVSPYFTRQFIGSSQMARTIMRMPRTAITRGELAAEVLAAIQREPGCAGVKEIGLTNVHVVDEGATWHVSIIDSGGVEFELANHAAWRVQSVLVEQYNLTD